MLNIFCRLGGCTREFVTLLPRLSSTAMSHCQSLTHSTGILSPAASHVRTTGSSSQSPFKAFVSLRISLCGRDALQTLACQWHCSKPQTSVKSGFCASERRYKGAYKAPPETTKDAAHPPDDVTLLHAGHDLASQQGGGQADQEAICCVQP